MDKVTYSFIAENIQDLAADLARALEIRLYAHESPIIGPWYSSEDLVAVTEALKAGMGYNEPARHFELLLNEREPGMTGPSYPGGGECLLLVRVHAKEIGDIERALRNSGLLFKRLDDVSTSSKTL